MTQLATERQDTDESGAQHKDEVWTSCPKCSALPGDACTGSTTWDTEIFGPAASGIHAVRLLPV